MTTEEKREYDRAKQREWRRNHPEYKEKAKARRKQRISEMTEAELQQRREIHNERNKKWAAKNRDLASRYTMESLARRFNCVIVPNTPDVQAALESVNEECKQIVQEARARQFETAIDNFNDVITTAVPSLKQATDIASETRDKIAETINQLDESALQPPAEIGNETVVTNIEIDDVFVMLASSITSDELYNLTIATA